MQDPLLPVWREVCRHVHLEESMAALVAMLARLLPLERLTIARFDRAARKLAYVSAPVRGGPAVASDGAPLAASEWSKLMRWASSGQLLHQKPGKRTAFVASFVHGRGDGESLILPLSSERVALGAASFEAPQNAHFTASHLRLVESLTEPFCAALENDQRLRELTMLRAAAEADRKSLLHRLGRQDLSDEVVGADGGLRHVMERVELLAKSDVPVLILGETGTGKEVVSRAIHSRSARRAGPFVRVNCGAIPPELIDSQLFGHEKGSFTGATDQRQGWFERADGGTLFLDEIGELPPPAQVRLLRVLQDHQIERVGGQKPVHVDVRVVAATHRDLAAMVEAGAFRQDLWYRVNVFPLLLPRLRERLEDIPELARHFARKAANRFGLPYVEPSPAILDMLAAYHWPGNIRELGAVVDRAAILGNGRSLEIAAALGLSGPPIFSDSEASTKGGRAPTPTSEQNPPIATLDAAMKGHIERALSAAQGRVEGPRGAARILNINPYTLRGRMRKLGVDWRRFRGI